MIDVSHRIHDTQNQHYNMSHRIHDTQNQHYNMSHRIHGTEPRLPVAITK